MTLRQKQSLFAWHIAKLILKAYELGFEVTCGYWTRSQEENDRIGGHPQSLHVKKLAVDLNLFRADATGRVRYLSSTKSHRVLGDWWVQQHELACWGGEWGDGNHYSFTHAGRK